MKITDLTWPPDLGLDDDLLIDVDVCRVALLVRGRNAWHSTWSVNYFRNAVLYPDVASAKAAAERLRGQGSVFYVTEAPALVLISELGRAVVCDAGCSDPFATFTGMDYQLCATEDGDYADGIYPGVPLRDAVATFDRRSGHWTEKGRRLHDVRLGRVDDATSLSDIAVDEPMLSLTSQGVGSRYALGWKPDPGTRTKPSSEGIRSLMRTWAELLADVAHELPDEDERDPETMRKYRDEVMGVEPRSVWHHRTTARAAEQRASTLALVQEWTAARSRAGELGESLYLATEAREAAQEARMTPASTSAGVRRQREKYEKALALEEALREQFKEADAVRAALWGQIKGG